MKTLQISRIDENYGESGGGLMKKRCDRLIGASLQLFPRAGKPGPTVPLSSPEIL